MKLGFALIRSVATESSKNKVREHSALRKVPTFWPGSQNHWPLISCKCPPQSSK